MDSKNRIRLKFEVGLQLWTTLHHCWHQYGLGKYWEY